MQQLNVLEAPLWSSVHAMLSHAANLIHAELLVPAQALSTTMYMSCIGAYQYYCVHELHWSLSVPLCT
jgi:hypothetical protein